jgi:uncharacterized protein (DUF983 family)
MATKSKATGFTVRCPYCDNQDGDVIISLNDLECHCSNCDEEFTPEQARAKAAELLGAWERVVRWVEVGRTMAAE